MKLHQEKWLKLEKFFENVRWLCLRHHHQINHVMRTTMQLKRNYPRKRQPRITGNNRTLDPFRSQNSGGLSLVSGDSASRPGSAYTEICSSTARHFARIREVLIERGVASSLNSDFLTPWLEIHGHVCCPWSNHFRTKSRPFRNGRNYCTLAWMTSKMSQEHLDRNFSRITPGMNLMINEFSYRIRWERWEFFVFASSETIKRSPFLQGGTMASFSVFPGTFMLDSATSTTHQWYNTNAT